MIKLETEKKGQCCFVEISQNSCIGYPICLKIHNTSDSTDKVICMDGQTAKNLISALLETLS